MAGMTIVRGLEGGDLGLGLFSQPTVQLRSIIGAGEGGHLSRHHRRPQRGPNGLEGGGEIVWWVLQRVHRDIGRRGLWGGWRGLV